MKHFYHGLFGKSSDWIPFISTGPDIFLHDLYRENKEDVLSIKTGSHDVLVGYSMGGRIALEIARRNHFNLKHLVLLSTHPGLVESERLERKVWEDSVLDNMKRMGITEFRQYWDNLNIFSSSQLREDLSLEDLRQSAYLFDEFRTSMIAFDLSHFSDHKEKITWIIGNQDSKYQALVVKKVAPLGIKIFSVNADHRVLQDQKSIKHIFQMKGII